MSGPTKGGNYIVQSAQTDAETFLNLRREEMPLPTVADIKKQAAKVQGLANALRIAKDLKTAYGLIGALENHMDVIDDMLSQYPTHLLGFVDDVRPHETPEELEKLVQEGWEAVHYNCPPVGAAPTNEERHSDYRD